MSTTSKRPGNDWEIGFCKWLAEKIVIEGENNLQRLSLLIQFKHGMKPSTTRTNYLDEWIKAGLIRINEDGLISVKNKNFFTELMGIADEELKAINKKSISRIKKKISLLSETDASERDKELYHLYMKNCKKDNELPKPFEEWQNERLKDNTKEI